MGWRYSLKVSQRDLELFFDKFAIRTVLSWQRAETVERSSEASRSKSARCHHGYLGGSGASPRRATLIRVSYVSSWNLVQALRKIPIYLSEHLILLLCDPERLILAIYIDWTVSSQRRIFDNV